MLDYIRDQRGNRANVDSRGIGIGTGAFSVSYTVTRVVKKHSVLDAIRNPGVFEDYVWGHLLDGTRALSFTWMF